MTKMTLDFSSSYRAITDADIELALQRDPYGYDNNGIPMGAVKFVGTSGSFTQPAANMYEGLDPRIAAHTASPDHMDLYDSSLVLSTYLRFEMSVDGPPLWEDYIDATYTGNAGVTKYGADFTAWTSAEYEWEQHILTDPFKASAATLNDDGGLLGNLSASAALIIDDFAHSTAFFSTVITGSQFSDDFSGGELADKLYGGNGNDSLQGLGGDDDILGDDGDDILDGAGGADAMLGGRGADVLFGGDGNDALTGQAGDDALNGGAGADHLVGGAGKDELHGGLDADTLSGSDDSDLLYGDDGNDNLSGGAQNDTLNGGAGADTLSGGADDDGLSGGEGDDVLTGGDGLDFLRGGVGKDRLTGNAGNDVFDFNSIGNANADRIADFEHGFDKIGLSSATFAGVLAKLDAQEFRLGTAALDGDDRIIYDQASGRLYYDPDGTLHGTHSAPAVLFAIISNLATLSYHDFLVH